MTPTPQLAECPQAPNGRHFWSTDGAECLWCHAVRPPGWVNAYVAPNGSVHTIGEPDEDVEDESGETPFQWSR